MNIYCIKENNKIVLPICMPPPVKAYLPFSIISSIIVANTKSYDWLYNNFIQLYQKKNINRIDTYPNQDFLFKAQAAITCTEINNFNYHIKEDIFIETIIDWINLENYVGVYLNEAYLKGTRGYKGNDMMHIQCIIGYDLKEKVFKVMNFSQDTLNMDILDIKFEDLKEGFFCEGTKALYHKQDVHGVHRGKEFEIMLFRYRQAIDYTYSADFNVDAINQGIKAYFNEENTSLRHPFFTDIQDGSWGMGVYKTFGEFVESDAKLHVTSLFLLNEHKIFMEERFKKLETMGVCNNIAESYMTIVDKSEMLVTAGLKYYMSKSEKAKIKVKRLLDKIYEEEKEVLQAYISQI